MIGIASMVAVLGLSESSKSELLAQLDRLGTNLLTVEAGAGIGRGAGQLPAEAATMVSRIGAVEATSGVSEVAADVYRNPFIPERPDRGYLRPRSGDGDLRRSGSIVEDLVS